MNNSKQDKTGYCVYVREERVVVLKINSNDFAIPGFSLVWIKQLLGGNLEDVGIDNSIYLEGVYKQFSDPAIDIFVDADGIGKELPLIAKSMRGLSLYGNVVVLASDENGETILLTQNQAQIALSELGFYKDYERVEIVDVEPKESEYLTHDQHPKALQNLLGLLIDYCVDEETQLLTKALNPQDINGDSALVACLYGDSEFINNAQLVIRDLIVQSNKNSKDV